MKHVLKGAVMSRVYGDAANSTINYSWCEVSSALTHEWWREQGYTFVCDSDIVFEELPREEAIKGEVEALQSKLRATQAKAQKTCTEIQGRINRLLALEYVPAEKPYGEFAPRHSQSEITDVYDQGATDARDFPL